MEDSNQQSLDRFTLLSSPGFDSGRGNWDEHSNYFDANNLRVIPLMAYGQYTPLSDPQYTGMNGDRVFFPHQMPATPPYHQRALLHGPLHVTSAPVVSHTELIPSRSGTQENFIDDTYFGPGSFGRGDHSRTSVRDRYKFTQEFGYIEPLPSGSALGTGRFISPSSSGSAYPQPIDIRSYQQNVAQGFGLTANSSPLHQAYQRNVGSSFNQNQYAKDKGGIHERDVNTVSISADALGSSCNWNGGPRASSPKGKSLLDKDSSSDIKDVESTYAFCDMFNLQDFKTDYEHAKFFVIKSFNEDNIYKSIKYSVWASTQLGNRKLDAAYRDAKEMEGSCPLFLFFSVNGSGQFCGVAEMVGPVDFENDADYWSQDRWSGQFPVKWHIIKDVPSSLFHGIRLENNDKKSVTRSRDSQEVELEQGIEMIKIFKNCDAKTSILDDFNFYEEREKVLRERKDKQKSSSTVNTPASPATEPINQLSDYLTDTLNLDSGENSS